MHYSGLEQSPIFSYTPADTCLGQLIRIPVARTTHINILTISCRPSQTPATRGENGPDPSSPLSLLFPRFPRSSVIMHNTVQHEILMHDAMCIFHARYFPAIVIDAYQGSSEGRMVFGSWTNGHEMAHMALHGKFTSMHGTHHV